MQKKKRTVPTVQMILTVLVLISFALATVAYAGEADVVKVSVRKKAENLYDFGVTVLHRDTGWDHYANRWEVLDGKGGVLATRTLHHPHVKEQPFTRYLSNVAIPADIKRVTIRAHDSVHQYGGKSREVELP
ncbi:MAG: hypothetical protein AB2598_03960 [Candidatus Thiodiazotropha sp.]